MSTGGNENAQVASTQLGFHFPSPAEVVSAGAALPAICIVLFCLRIYARLSHNADEKRMKLGWDDAFTFVSLLGLIGMGICLIYGVEKGVLAYPSPLNQLVDSTYAEVPSLKLNQELVYAFFLAMALSLGFIKLGILVFFRRLFFTHGRNILNYITYFLIIIVSLWTLTFTLAFVFTCGTDIPQNWGGILEKDKFCTSQFLIYEAFAISDFILDVIVLSLPFPLIWTLKMTNYRKFLVSIVFILAWLAVSASIVRVVVYKRILGGGFGEARSNVDLVVTLSLYWSTIEAGVMWIAACLPLLYGLFRRMLGKDPMASIRLALSNLSLSSFTSGRNNSNEYSSARAAEHNIQTTDGTERVETK